MAIKMRKKEAEVEVMEAELKASAPTETVENPHINEDEQKALAEQVKSDEAKSKEISIKKIENTKFDNICTFRVKTGADVLTMVDYLSSVSSPGTRHSA